MRYFLPDGTETSNPHDGVEPGTLGDGYTYAPTHVRIYKEDCGDEWPWHIDGVDATGNYSEAVERYATESDALAALPRFVAENFGGA